MLKKKQADFIRPVSMDFPFWLYVFALCSILPTGVHCQCGNPGPGRCNANNSQFISDREVVSPSALSCPFLGSLCNYRQGCQDEDMSPWTAGKGYSQASQKRTATCGQTTYSVLESRWIQFSIPVCLQFSFSRYRPQALAVFFEPYSTGSTAVTTLLAKDKNTVNDGNIQVVNVTINKTTGKVLFRIFGGGPGNNRVLKLYPVTYQDGRCETPGCSFTGDSEQMCGWTAVNWRKATKGVLVDAVTTTRGAATLTSPLTRATGENHTDCLTFKFRLRNATDSLNVALKVSGVMTTVWSANNLTSTTQVEGQVQIVTFEAYQIVFIEHKPQIGGRVIVSDVSLKANVSQDCAAKPKEAAVNVTWPLGNPPPSSGSSTDAGAIAGAVVSVLFVIAIVAIGGVFFYRRRLRRKPEHERKSREKHALRTGAQERGNAEASDGDYTEIRVSQILHTPSADDTRSGIPNPASDDVNPYDVADEDGQITAPTNDGNGYHHLNRKVISKPPAYGKLPKPAEEDYNHLGDSRKAPTPGSSNSASDDYNHIGGSRNTPTADASSGLGDDYSHIGGSRKNLTPAENSGSLGDDYSHIGGGSQSHHPAGNVERGHGAGKATPRLQPGYELARVGTPTEPGGSRTKGSHHVREEPHTSSVPPGDDGGYSTIQDGDGVAREGSGNRPSPTGKASFPEPPKHPQGYCNAGGRQKDSAKAQGIGLKGGSTTGDYSLQKPIPEGPADDDYNSLNFDEAPEESAKNYKPAPLRAPYDHVQCDPDDDYSKTRIEKRNVVIDSDYDHVRR